MISCAICGCTERRACDGGCFWVAGLPGPVCSRCVLNALAESGAGLDAAPRRQLAGELMVLAGTIDPEEGGFDTSLLDGGASAGVEDHFDTFGEPRLWRPGDPL